MDNVLLILPDFLIILLGALLSARFNYDRNFWKSAERLVFNVLFPPLLFLSVARSSASLSEAGYFLLVGVVTMLFAVLASASVKLFVKADDWTHASVFQCGFRFNTYIGFAIVLKLVGADGLALMALLISIWVPISNTIAVAVLALAVQKKENSASSAPKNRILINTVSAVVRNPLIIATVLGLAVKIVEIPVPTPAADFLNSLGKASLAMGLLCIGAGIKIQDLSRYKALIAACTVERLVAVPVIALAAGLITGLMPVEYATLLVFAALPTAQSCYVMTSAMRGNAPAVADVTACQTLASMFTLTCWSFVITGWIMN